MYSLPLFPLDTVLFPGTPIHLHIFEERYKIMMKRVLSENGIFGVILIHNGVEAYGPIAEPHKIGCTAKVIEVDALPDGRMNLVCLGQEIFRIRELNYNLPYLVAEVDTIISEQPRTLETVRGAHILRNLVDEYLRLVASIPTETANEDDELSTYLRQVKLPEDPTMLVFMACTFLQIPTIEKQNLLEISSIQNLYTTVLRLYRREITVNSKIIENPDDATQKSAWLN